MRSEFIQALKTHQSAFDLDLADKPIGRLADYYDLVQEHNPLLHLVGPCSPEDFAIRHILESLTLLDHLPMKARFADVGAGAGLPSIPCLLVRDDLRGVLIESKEKKAVFLTHAINKLVIGTKAQIYTRQFQEVDPVSCQFVTCRALDKFTERLPRLINWSQPRPMLLFGGPNLAEALLKEKVKFTQKLMLLSEQRFLFIIR